MNAKASGSLADLGTAAGPLEALLGESERVTAWIDSCDGVVDCPTVVMWKYRDRPLYGVADLVHAAKLMHSGVEPVAACRSAIAQALTDDADMLAAVNELSSSLF